MMLRSTNFSKFAEPRSVSEKQVNSGITYQLLHFCLTVFNNAKFEEGGNE